MPRGRESDRASFRGRVPARAVLAGGTALRVRQLNLIPSIEGAPSAIVRVAVPSSQANVPEQAKRRRPSGEAGGMMCAIKQGGETIRFDREAGGPRRAWNLARLANSVKMSEAEALRTPLGTKYARSAVFSSTLPDAVATISLRGPIAELGILIWTANLGLGASPANFAAA